MVGRNNELVKENQERKFDYTSYVRKTVEDYFIEYLFPDAIIYGMSYDEFWCKDPELFYSYRFSYMKKVKIEQEMANYNAWLKGMYNYEAFAVTINNSFGGKGTKKQSYPEKPHDIFGKEKPKTDEQFLDVRQYWSRFKERRSK